MCLKVNKCVCAHGKCISELAYLYERAPVLEMPQPFTVHRLSHGNFHPEVPEHNLDYAP